MPISDLEALERAARAYFRAGTAPQPSHIGDVDCVRWRAGKRYVVFSNSAGVLAAYIVGEHGVRRLRTGLIPNDVM